MTVAVLALPAPGSAQDLEDINGVDLTIGGWASFTFEDNDKTDNKAGFDLHHWYVYLKGEPIEGWHFFGEVEAEHIFRIHDSGSTSGAGELKAERLYIQRNFSDLHRVRGGKFFLPFGYWYRQHWDFLTETLSRPYTFSNSYTPQFQVGLEYFGKAFAGDTRVDYFAWLGNGPDQFGTNDRTTEDLSIGASAFVEHRIGGASDLRVGGVVGYHAQKVALPGADESERNYVVGLEGRIKKAEIRAELYQHDRSRGDDLTSFYANALYWVLPHVGINYRFDIGDDEKNTDPVPDSDGISHSLGFLWRPYAKLVMKGEYRTNRYDDSAVEDFDQWNLLIALKY